MDSDNRIFKNKIADYVDLSQDKGIISHTNFLNPYEQSQAMGMIRKNNNIKYTFNGGYPEAERRVLTISPNTDWADDIDAQIVAVKITFSKHDAKYLEHRSILGAVLGLGIRREAVGDIIISDGTAYIFSDEKMGEFIHGNLLTIGRATVSSELIADTAAIGVGAGDSFFIKTTIASLRMDCVLAAALKTSRNNATQYIQDDLVFVDWNLVKKPTKIVEVDQTISIRKKGRICLRTIGNRSQKNRIWVEIECWLS